jgi:hypothetical protein
MLDLFCGRFGWGRAFAERGWEVVGVDLMEPGEIPSRCLFFQADVLDWDAKAVTWQDVDFICASSPCEQFSLFGMKHFHPNPPYPELGIKLFNHTRAICEASGVPYVMENVRPAQHFVGGAVNHCGPFYLWGTGVPPLLPQGIKKGLSMKRDPITGKRELRLGRRSSHGSKMRARDKAITATIPSCLSNCVADYAERICEGDLCPIAK